MMSWQAQLKRAQTSNRLSADKLGTIVRPSQQVGFDFLKRYEWLGTPGMTRWMFGLQIDEGLSAVVGFGLPSMHTAMTAILPPGYSAGVVQLTRGATAPGAHPHAASHLISRSIRLLGRERSLTLVLAYADPRAGELGTSYRSCNALYLGLTATGGAEAYIIHGRRYSARATYRRFGTTAHARLLRIDPGARQIPRARKYRYAIPAGKPSIRRKVRRLLLPLSKEPPEVRTYAGEYARVVGRSCPLNGADER